MNSDGTDQIQLTDHPASDNEPVFSPDGLSIIFTSERDGNKEIYSYDIYEKFSVKNLTMNLGLDEQITYQPWFE